MKQTIDVTPNFTAMFDRLVPEIKFYTQRVLVDVSTVGKMPAVEDRNEYISSTLKNLNGLLYALSICASSFTTQEQLDQYRDAVAESLSTINNAFRDAQEKEDE